MAGESGPAAEGIARNAREALARHDWPTARAQFAEAIAHGAASGDDLRKSGEADWWLGLITSALDAYQLAYRAHLREDRPDRAAMDAFDIAGVLFLRGEMAAGSAWLGRFQRLLAELPDGPPHGYARFVELEGVLGGGSLEQILPAAHEVQAAGRRYADDNLVALGLMGEGRALIRFGRVRDGLARLDEAMLVAIADGIDPAFAGNIYCNTIAACHELGDLARMRHWTEALASWCAALPAAVLFTGICRVHQAQLLAVQGSWELAEGEAARVCVELDGIQTSSVAEAWYVIGEFRICRGDLPGAESALVRAEQLGRDPQPALATLRLAQDEPVSARAMIDAALIGAADRPLTRARLLVVRVEAALACHDVPAARSAADELDAIATAYDSPGLHAEALRAGGAVLLAEARAGEALTQLQAAVRAWRELAAPCEVGRCQVLLGQACRDLADDDGMRRAFDAASDVFGRLGAAPDLHRLDRLRRPVGLPDGLTAREVEILAMIATGSSNREVADALVISPKTVARHLANIFAKCEVSSRTAAAAYAFERGLVPAIGHPTHALADGLHNSPDAPG